MVTNASMLLKQRQTPVGPKPPNPGAGPPVVPGAGGPGMGGAPNTGLGLGPNLGQPNIGGTSVSSSQVLIVILSQKELRALRGFFAPPPPPL